MKRFLRFLASIPILIICTAVAESITSGKAGAQREPTIRGSVRPNLDSLGNVPKKINPLLPWVSNYEQPPVYALWWKKIADCEHLILPVELSKAVKFVQVNSETFTRGQRPEYLYGFTQPEVLTIFLAQSVVNEYETTAHEMTHMLAFWNGIETGLDYHPPDLFESEKCGLHTTHK